jgi:hypothetical protein
MCEVAEEGGHLHQVSLNHQLELPSHVRPQKQKVAHVLHAIDLWTHAHQWRQKDVHLQRCVPVRRHTQTGMVENSEIR